MKLFNDGWQFAKDEPENFSSVSIPHDWLISDSKKLYESSIGWYKRELDTSFLKNDQRLILRFDGVYMDSTLFVNDKQVGEWKYGYTAFEHDITDFVNKDRINILLLKVVYTSPNARWYTGAGIYRNVFIKVKNSCRFLSDGIYITTEKRNGKWFFEAEVEVETGGKPYTHTHTLLCDEAEIEAWDVDRPRLYTIRSELIVDGIITDSEDTRIGFRTIEFTPDSGFFINDRHLKLNGICLHHDLGSLGATMYPDAIRRQFSLFKSMGVNAIRTAHNPPSKEFMEIADEMGLLVMSEILDMWKSAKNEWDYARFFDDWIDRDVASWIRRDRNHPSIILWSVGNEIPDTHIYAQEGMETLKRMISLVKKHDPKSHASITLCSNYMPWGNTQKCADVIKIMGYNYGEHLYAKHHQEHPNWIIYGSETCATAQSRGVYHFPLAKSILADDDLQCSALGNSATSWGAKSVESCIIGDANTPYSLGQFIWAGQDYLGEPTPYHTKNAYLGHVDTAGFPKDTFYLFQAAWTNSAMIPMVHIFPYWDFSPGEIIDVRVCSNAFEVELFFDNDSLGTIPLKKRFIADWQIPYKKGCLKAIARDEKGNILAQTSRVSFGDAMSLCIKADKFGELTFFTITAIDNEGNIVENANRRVHISASKGTLLALDNGDSTDYDQYTDSSRRLFAGKLLAIVKSSCGSEPEITAIFDEKDIPVRKIELVARGYEIVANVFPPNTTYTDLYWRLTDEGGIDSSLATMIIAKNGKSAKLTPKGDGKVYVRCCAKNGADHISLISQLSINISGMGKIFLDPYSFVSGGLYNYSNIDLTNGNERGVATARSGESHVGFRDLDFGTFGSDEIRVSLFPLDKEPFTFEIWEGIPLEGGSHLCKVTYDKGSVWNTYQESTYVLPHHLKNITTITFVFKQKVHIKGFLFKKLNKAFQRIPAADHDKIYGDYFTVKNGGVENIKNNVSIIFNNMDFGKLGSKAVMLKWKSNLPKNSIQLIFANGEHTSIDMIIVEGSKSWKSAVFPLQHKVFGENTLTLSFLPGSFLDLAWIQFLER